MWHVDDLKVSHANPKVVDSFIEWIERKHGDPKLGKVKAKRGKVHDCLGMTLDFSEKWKVKIDQTKGIKQMLEEFPEPIRSTAETPAAENLFDVHESPLLDRDKADIFHSFVAKNLCFCKRGRPDIQVAVAFLCTRVKEPTQQDWHKLMRLMRHLKRTQDVILTLGTTVGAVMKWFADAAFAVHQDMKSHTGLNMTWGQGSVISASRKQKLNTTSSCEAELVAANDAMGPLMWTKLFLQKQGCNPTVMFEQDNTSAILLERNGKSSSGKRTRHLNIRFFCITDLLEKQEFEVEHCPTEDMQADFLTKPLQGEKFKKMFEWLMGIE